MQGVIESWGRVQNPLDAAQSRSWLGLARTALEAGGVLALDPRDGDHAAHIETRLGGDAHLSAYFPRKADMLRATAAAYDVYGAPPKRTLLEIGPERAGYVDLHPYVGVPHLAFRHDMDAVVAVGIVSHTQSLHALETVLEILDADTGELLGATSIPPQFNTGYQRVTATAALKPGARPRSVIAGLTANFVVDGEPHANPIFAAATADSTNAITVVTPFAPLPIKHPQAKQVVIAIVRDGKDADYSYAGPPNVPNEVIVPFSGQAQLAAGYTVGSPPCQTGSLILQVAGEGGAKYALATSDIIAAFSASQGIVATWTMGPDWEQTFKESGGNTTFSIALQATLNVMSGGVPSTAQLVVSSEGPVSPGGQLLPLNIQWGCLAPGTQVRLADGTERAIEQIREGECVLADATGRTMAVGCVMTGEEHEPMWRLRAAGCTLLATHDHPVLTPGGPVAIETLRRGDIVLTLDGPLPIEHIAAEEYDGRIFNLRLESADGVIPVHGDSFVASGVLVGDNTMQNALPAMAPVPEIPAEWRADAENAARLAAGLPLVAAA